MSSPYPKVYNYLDDDGSSIHLTQPFSVIVNLGNLVYEITVPKGFHSDLASVPKIARRFVPVHGKYSPSAIVHDYLIENKLFSRKTADDIFNEMNKKLGVKRWRRKIMYMAVRAHGSLKKNRY